MLISSRSVNKHGRHRRLLFLIGWFLRFFSSQTAWPNEPKLGRQNERWATQAQLSAEPLVNLHNTLLQMIKVKPYYILTVTIKALTCGILDLILCKKLLFFLLPGRIFGRAYSCWFRPNSMVSRWYHHGLCFAYFFGILTYYNKIQVKSDLDYHDNCKMYKSLINNKPYIHNVSNVFCEDI